MNLEMPLLFSRVFTTNSTRATGPARVRPEVQGYPDEPRNQRMNVRG